MYVPEAWQRRRFDEWNLLVKGLMEAWDYAEALGVEECLNWHLNVDTDGRLAELLSRMGCREGKTSPVRTFRRGNGSRNNGHSTTDGEVEAYWRSCGGEQPTEQAFEGAQLVRDFLLRVEQFAQEKGVGMRDLRRILCEAICVYSDGEELSYTLPLFSS